MENALIARLQRALQALRQLVADPEDTPKVFEIARALGVPALNRGTQRFKATPVGRRILAERIDLLDTLQDRAALAALPAGSLGRAYYDFVYRENLSADGLVEASVMGGSQPELDDPDTRRYAGRLREQHDLWHTLTGYGRDPFGEICLLTFTYAQTRNSGLGADCRGRRLERRDQTRATGAESDVGGLPCRPPCELVAGTGLGTALAPPR